MSSRNAALSDDAKNGCVADHIFTSVARENSRHFVTSPLVFPPNDVWGTSAEIHTSPLWLLSILMTCLYPDLSSASDWLKQIFLVAWPIRSTTQIWVVARRRYGISAPLPTRANDTLFEDRDPHWAPPSNYRKAQYHPTTTITLLIAMKCIKHTTYI